MCFVSGDSARLRRAYMAYNSGMSFWGYLEYPRFPLRNEALFWYLLFHSEIPGKRTREQNAVPQRSSWGIETTGIHSKGKVTFFVKIKIPRERFFFKGFKGESKRSAHSLSHSLLLIIQNFHREISVIHLKSP